MWISRSEWRDLNRRLKDIEDELRSKQDKQFYVPPYGWEVQASVTDILRLLLDHLRLNFRRSPEKTELVPRTAADYEQKAP